MHPPDNPKVETIALISRRKFLSRISVLISSFALLPHKIARSGMAFMNMGAMWKRPAYTLWAWGENDSSAFGQLGLGDTINRSSPVQVGGRNDWLQVVSGTNYGSYGIRVSTSLFTFGYGASGQLGSGATTARSTPVQVGGLNWSQVSGGYGFGLGINSGALFSWGSNSNGILGLGDVVNRSSPTQIGSGTSWSQISAGGSFAAAIKTDGSLWTWGYNANGQLGHDIGGVPGTAGQMYYTKPYQLAGVSFTSFSCGDAASYALDGSGALWSWGYNQYGQLGFGDTATTRSVPVQVGTGWSKIVGGYRAAGGIKSDGSLWMWGANTNGALGLGDTNNRSAPVQIGALTSWSAFSMSMGNYTHGAIRADGTLWLWGLNSNGQLGLGDTINRSSPVQVGASTNWLNTSLTIGTDHVLALKTDGTLWTWGYNGHGQLGLLDTVKRSSPTQISGTGWQSVAAADECSFFTKTDGALWAVGWNNGPSLGIGDATSRSSLTQVSGSGWSKVYASTDQAYAIKTDGTLWAWGDNSHAALGNGLFLNVSTPVQIGTATSWSSISSGALHTLGMRTDGTFWVWGSDWGVGSLGVGMDSGARSSPVQVGTSTDWKMVSATYESAAAIKTDGSLWTWGNGGDGSLGLGNLNDQYSPLQLGTLGWKTVCMIGTPVTGVSSTFGIQTDCTLWSWGKNNYGQLGLGNTFSISSSPVQVGTGWSSVAGNYYSVAAIKTDGSLWAWGYNLYGPLGFGDTISRSTPTQIGSATSWVSVSVGNYAVFALSK